LKAALQAWGLLPERGATTKTQAKRIKPQLLIMGPPARFVRRQFKLAHGWPATNKWDAQTIKALARYGPQPATSPNGIDYAGGYASALPAQLKAKRILTCFRYFAYSAWKSITKSEWQGLDSAGICVAPLYEEGASSMLDGAPFGIRAALRVRDAVHAFAGKGATFTILLCADFEVRLWHKPAIKRAMFAAAKELGGKEWVSGYGDATFCRWLIAWGFPAPLQCTAWSYGVWVKGACAQQHLGHPYGSLPGIGLDYDADVITGTVGVIRKAA
jgi:hypothetical protein